MKLNPNNNNKLKREQTCSKSSKRIKICSLTKSIKLTYPLLGRKGEKHKLPIARMRKGKTF